MKKILITGAAGFIGSHLVEFYLNQKYQVIGIDNFATGSKTKIDSLLKHFPDQFKFIEFDVCENWNTIPSADLIFHLASPASVQAYQKLNLETMWTNSVGLKNAIAHADKSQGRVIFSSTSEVYGSPLSSPQKESDWGHVNSFGERSCYDEAKRFGEALIYTSNKRNKTRHGVVRIFNTYGDGMLADDGRVVIQFLQQALSNQALSIYGDGQQTRSFCYIDDLIEGLNAYALSDIDTPVNLGNDREFTMLELAQLVIRVTESKSKMTYLALPSDDPPQRRPDLSLAKKLLNYHCDISLEDGIKRMLKSSKTNIQSVT